ncbi:MAG: prolipoprotein diacylglyceryl transferase [Vicingaceae bacterium]|nr:prolipoprotein diacylglyceryl transferase [Vicingaceae bacterium]
MFPFLSDLLNYLFGISFSFPLPMFGFMVALAFIAANLLFVREMKRKENEGLLSYSIIKVVKGEKASINELIGNGIFGFVVGYKIGGILFNYAEATADLPDFVLSLKGNLIAGIVGAIALAYLKYRDAEKQRLPEPKEVEEKMHPYQHVGNMTFIAAVGGILGAKLFDAIEDLERFLADPIGVLFSGSGLSIYGGLIIGGGAVIYYAYKKGLKLVHVIDACAPGLMLAYGIGRIGCQLSGDGDWGTTNELPMPEALSFLPEWMWSFTYPHNVNADGILIAACEENYCEELCRKGYCYALEKPVWPTPFYETIMAFIIFGGLWLFRKKITIPGLMFSIYLIFNGIERFFIEKIRINPDYNIFGMKATQAEIIAIILFLIGVVGAFYVIQQNRNKPIINNH